MVAFIPKHFSSVTSYLLCQSYFLAVNAVLYRSLEDVRRIFSIKGSRYTQSTTIDFVTVRNCSPSIIH